MMICTSQLQAWNQPRKRHLDTSILTDIDFSQHEFEESIPAQSMTPVLKICVPQLKMK